MWLLGSAVVGCPRVSKGRRISVLCTCVRTVYHASAQRGIRGAAAGRSATWLRRSSSWAHSRQGEFYIEREAPHRLRLAGEARRPATKGGTALRSRAVGVLPLLPLPLASHRGSAPCSAGERISRGKLRTGQLRRGVQRGTGQPEDGGDNVRAGAGAGGAHWLAYHREPERQSGENPCSQQPQRQHPVYTERQHDSHVRPRVIIAAGIYL